MRKADARELIRQSMRYKSGDVYMGSMMIAMVYNAVGIKYGQDDIDQGLEHATTDQLIRALSVCQSTIDYMNKYPMRHCPHCGQLTPK